MHLQCEGWRGAQRWWKGAPQRQETGRKSPVSTKDPQFQPKIFLEPHFVDFRCKSMQCFTAISRRRNISVVVVWSRMFVRGSHASELMDWWKMMKVRYKVKEDQVTITFIWLLQCMQNKWSIIAQLFRSVGGAVSSFKSCIFVVDRLSCNVNISWIRKGLLLAGGAPAMPTYLVQRACTAMAGTPSTWATHKDGSDSLLLSWEP